MKLIEKHVRLVIAVLVLIIVMLSIALWSSSYINRLDTYYFNEYLDSADTLEWVSYNLPKKFALHGGKNGKKYRYSNEWKNRNRNQ